MMDNLNPEEVKLHLKQRGIQNIGDKDRLFKEFMKDLKKIIKYERRINEGIHHNVSRSEDKAVSKKSGFNMEKNPQGQVLAQTDDNASVTTNERSMFKPNEEIIRVNKIRKGVRRPANDPVRLHQYYQRIWRHSFIPGDTDNTKRRQMKT